MLGGSSMNSNTQCAILQHYDQGLHNGQFTEGWLGAILRYAFFGHLSTLFVLILWMC